MRYRTSKQQDCGVLLLLRLKMAKRIIENEAKSRVYIDFVVRC
jgi:hypothetical protein